MCGRLLDLKVEDGANAVSAGCERCGGAYVFFGPITGEVSIADADMERAVHAALGGTFINCGQNCVASERILVHRSKLAWFEGRIASHLAGSAFAACARPVSSAQNGSLGSMAVPSSRVPVQ